MKLFSMIKTASEWQIKKKKKRKGNKFCRPVLCDELLQVCVSEGVPLSLCVYP